jgi:predicted nucleic acid-binding protein
MMTVDSSVWIDYLKGTQTSQTKQLDAMLGDSSLDVVILDVVLMEVLRGIRSDHEYKNTKEALTALPVQPVGGEKIAIGAAQICWSQHGVCITMRICCTMTAILPSLQTLSHWQAL